MRAAYWDPEQDASVIVDDPTAHMHELVATILRHRSGRGHPALEVTRPDGAVAVLGTDGSFAVVSWTDALGETFTSVGHGLAGTSLVFDYFGSWTEAPESALISLADAVECLSRFEALGVPETERVNFQPD